MESNIYTKENPLKVVTLCSGYDSQCLALERLKQHYPNFDYELVAWAEFDPESKSPLEKQPAVIAHNALFPQWADRNLGDMTKIDWTKVEDFDLLFYSTPCFVAGTLILTEDGYKPIEDVKMGDSVLTHTNKFKRVTAVGSKPYKGMMVKLWGMGTDIIYCTEEHPFYVRRMYLKGHDSERCFHEPEWIKAKNLDKNTYLGYAINTKSELPEWDGSVDNRWGHAKRVNHLKPLFTNLSFWYLMGRYLGDGWKRTNEQYGSSIIICCSERNHDSLIKAFGDCGLHVSEVKERTVTKVHCSMNELHDFVSRYGYYAHGKKIDAETLNLPVEYLGKFIEGYLDSDGHFDGTLYKTSSVSRELCFGIAQCVAKVYHRPFSLYRTARPSQTEIEGRVVNQKDSYTVTWKATSDKQDKAFYEDGYIWYPLSKLPVLQEDSVEVFNMSVEDDESYTANGAIVHNCQSISAAGLQHGFAEGSGTRSSIIWYVRDAVKEKRPKFLCLENVKAMVSRKFLPMFNLWQTELERLGYVNFAQVLNAKDYGVPQNRERIFLVSIYADELDALAGKVKYYFPKPLPLEKRLKDVLEDKVDEKYYLSDKMLEYFQQVNADESHNHKFKPTDGGGTASTVKAKDIDADSNFVMTEGMCSNSQDGVVVNKGGIAPCHTAGHGNCCKVIE